MYQLWCFHASLPLAACHFATSIIVIVQLRKRNIVAWDDQAAT